MPALDLEPCDRLAMSICRQAVELARAPVGAVAVDEFTPFDRPFSVRVRHGGLPQRTECYQMGAAFERRRGCACIAPEPLRIVAATHFGCGSPDDDPNHHVPGVANSGEQKRDLSSGEPVEPRFRLA